MPQDNQRMEGEGQAPVGGRKPRSAAAMVLGILVAITAGIVGFKVVWRLMTPDEREPTAFVAFQDPEGTFHVEVPKGMKMKPETMIVQTSSGDALSCRSYNGVLGRYGLGVVVFDIKAADLRQGRTRRQIADDVLKGALRNMGMQVTAMEPRINIRTGYPVPRCAGTGTIKGNAMDAVGECHVLSRRSFALLALTRKGKLETSQTIARFLESFRPAGTSLAE